MVKTKRTKSVKRAKKSTRSSSAKRMMQFLLDAPQASRVSVAGSFNNWDTQSLSAKRDKKGTWKVRLSLPKGRHEYRFIVDDQWWSDPRSSECVSNEFGSINNVLEVK